MYIRISIHCTCMHTAVIIVESSVFTWQWLKYLGHNQNVSDNIWLKINLSISQGELVANICKVSRKHIHILTTAGDCCQVKSSQTIGQNTSAAGSRETKTTDVQCIILYLHNSIKTYTVYPQTSDKRQYMHIHMYM